MGQRGRIRDVVDEHCSIGDGEGLGDLRGLCEVQRWELQRVDLVDLLFNGDGVAATMSVGGGCELSRIGEDACADLGKNSASNLAGRGGPLVSIP